MPRLVTSNPLRISDLMAQPLAVRRRWVRAAAPPDLQLEFGQIQSILEVAAGTEDDPRPAICPLVGRCSVWKAGLHSSRPSLRNSLREASMGRFRVLFACLFPERLATRALFDALKRGE